MIAQLLRKLLAWYRTFSKLPPLHLLFRCTLAIAVPPLSASSPALVATAAVVAKAAIIKKSPGLMICLSGHDVVAT